MERLDRSELVAHVSGAMPLDDRWRHGTGGAVVVDLRNGAKSTSAPSLGVFPRVVVGISERPDDEALALTDVIVSTDAAVDQVVAAVNAHPIAATTLALLLRASETRKRTEGLHAESTAYSTLQAGPEFQKWLASRVRRAPTPEDGDAVLIERTDEEFRITLNRPHRHNAFNTEMRDALLDALIIAIHEPALSVRIDGAGPTFCSGGDLDEFGTFADPATAHLVRVGSTVGLAIEGLSRRRTVEVDVHGTCMGAGVELPAFSRYVVADPDTTFALPEVAMGLVPGAGGTASLPPRIGRHRTAWLALTGEPISAETALDWRLIDEIRDGIRDRALDR